MKFIHYTEKDKYFYDYTFKPAFEFGLKSKYLKKYGSRFLGEHIKEGIIIVKKMTKKEVKKEWEKHISAFYKYLKEKDIPFIKMYKETKKKVMIAKFLGAELFVYKWM